MLKIHALSIVFYLWSVQHAVFFNYFLEGITFKLQLHDATYRLRFFSNSLMYILSLSNSHNNVASVQKNRGDKSHLVMVALVTQQLIPDKVSIHIAIIRN